MGKVIIIGGGASGLMAAGKAAQRGNEVHIFEKNDRLGKKIYITGKGRCNITNDSDVENFIANIPGNPYFLYSALYGFTSEDTISFFNSLGLKTKVERGNRVFPVTDKAADVVAAFEKYMKEMKVNIHLNSPVDSIIIKDKNAVGIKTNGKEILSDAVIVATGGLSYPGTGSTGDGYRFAKKCGHTVTDLYPSLVPLKTEEKWCADLMGLSLKNVAITLKDEKGKKIYTDFGEMLFTHFGVSGPMILSASCHITGLPGGRKVKLYIDLKPALDEKVLDNRIIRDFEKFINKNFANSLDELLPKKLIPVIIKLSGIDEFKKVHDITKEERKRLVSLIKALPLTITGATGFNDAVVTRGGINVDEINPSTMESKIIKNLYFIGEVLDCDGYTGGFNLQIAFSTGFAAGSNVCNYDLEDRK
ncbi:MAG: NAD(P)/FAD-dependent oxidoreductase [Clostridia bacterium]|jgi:predicted Rossmann fold flavoprotein|nr:NAD(P)/FAD-dependent oxidoreductase [Clostridia bacterium]MCI1999116.1 NAD(P)/FAD-dependent oxidoreductase [Clostridia bacterium]MCI2013866.1 NAD(P)/FAD-dependent oxidoreductase [Clostridia bacterium]